MKQLLRRLIDLAGVSAAAPAAFLAILVGAAIVTQPVAVRAQTLEDPTLAVSTVVSGLNQSIAMAFIGPDDFLVTEKASGQVKRVTNGVVTGVVLDLAVNSNSERGLLGMALHPGFPQRAVCVSLQHREHDRRRHERRGQCSVARQSCGPIHVERQHADLRQEHHQAARLSERPQQREPIRRCPCCGATTMAACCASVPTASCTSSSATMAGAASRRTTWRVQCRTTTSAGPNRTTRT